MRYTFFCERGRLYRPGLHYLMIGEWIVPDPVRFVILAHGNMTSHEYAYIEKNGYCKIYFESHYHLLRIYQMPLEWHAAKYHDAHGRSCGTMKRSGRYHNLYIGQINMEALKGVL